MQSESVLSSLSLGRVTALPTPLTKLVTQLDRGPKVTQEGTTFTLTSGHSECRFAWWGWHD